MSRRVKRRRAIPIDLFATMRLARDPDRSVHLDLGDLTWSAHGLEALGPVNTAMLDLLEIARVVHEFDRRRPKRTTGVRVKQVHVTMPVRAPTRWTAAAKEELGALLRIQGNAEWIFDLKKRQVAKSSADALFATAAKARRARKPRGKPAPSATAVRAVALFSGGLDSTCGLATLAERASETLLVAYYAQNRAKQARIADKLGFERFVQIKSQWTSAEPTARGGGQFLYRSFLFLSLAAVLANATGAPSLLQFENGPLALAVPPLEIYRMTRHAHPLVHMHFANLYERLTGRALAVSNPFVAMTKGEAASGLRKHLSLADFKEVIADTESCWYLNSRTIIAGAARKRNGLACGACVPCLIRRAALGADDTPAAADFRAGTDRAVRDPVVRVHYDAYSAFARRLLDKRYGLFDFLDEAPAATRTALKAGIAIKPDAAFSLYRRFAREWIGAFP